MNSVALEMMALLKGKSPTPEDQDKNYTSGMTPDMYDQSDMITNQEYDEEDEDEDEYFEELQPYGEEEEPIVVLPNLPKTDSENIKLLEEQLLSCSATTESQPPEKKKELEIQFENSVKGESEKKVKPKVASFVLQDQKITKIAAQMQKSRVNEISQRLYTGKTRSPKEQKINFFRRGSINSDLKQQYSLEQAQEMIGFRLHPYANNIKKLIQDLKTLKKVQKQMEKNKNTKSKSPEKPNRDSAKKQKQQELQAQKNEFLQKKKNVVKFHGILESNFKNQKIKKQDFFVSEGSSKIDQLDANQVQTIFNHCIGLKKNINSLEEQQIKHFDELRKNDIQKLNQLYDEAIKIIQKFMQQKIVTQQKQTVNALNAQILAKKNTIQMLKNVNHNFKRKYIKKNLDLKNIGLPKTIEIASDIIPKVEEKSYHSQNSSAEKIKVKSNIPHSKTLDEIRYRDVTARISQWYDSHINKNAPGYHIISEKSIEETLGNENESKKFTIDSIQSLREIKTDLIESEKSPLIRRQNSIGSNGIKKSSDKKEDEKNELSQITESQMEDLVSPQVNKKKKNIDQTVLPSLNYKIQMSFVEENEKEAKQYKSQNDSKQSKIEKSQSEVPAQSPTMRDIPDLLESRQKQKNRDQIKKIDLFKKDEEKDQKKEINQEHRSPGQRSDMDKSYNSIEKVNTFAGVTDDTIYGHQPSNNDPNDYNTNNYMSKNSNFRSVYNGKITATIKQENEVMENISTVFQQQDSNKTQPENTQGLWISNVNSTQMKIVLEFMKTGQANFPNDLIKLIQLYGIAEYFLMEKFMKAVIIKIVELPFFTQFTNVRRYITMYVKQTSQQMTSVILENLPADVLVFTLTDPMLADYLPDLSIFKPIFVKQYKQFTIDRINHFEKLREKNQDVYIYEEDMQLLPKEYYPIYKDTKENSSYDDQIAQQVMEQIQELRQIFKEMLKEFDFHQCFYYMIYKDFNPSEIPKDLTNNGKGAFKLHQRYVQAQDFNNNIPKLHFPLILLSTINATGFVGCFCEIFQLSLKFSHIRVLNLRGCDNNTVSKTKLMRILKNCDRIAHLNLSFMQEQVDEDVLAMIGDNFQKTIISLELRACSKVNDKALIGMCERLSGIHKLRNGVEPKNDNERYKFIKQQENHENLNQLEFLNLSDLKQIGNASMKSIAHNLFNKLQDLSIWGSYHITNDGFLSLCSNENPFFKRINYCGCYKISDESSQWIGDRILVYIQSDDFGIHIDYDQYHM